jgi:dUTP pyrophosphatase
MSEPESRPLHVRVARARGADVPLPKYQTAGAAGMDLHAATSDAVVIAPRGRHLFPTGLSFAIPDGYEGQVRPRSGLASKLGVTVLNAPGTIDSDYRGEVMVLLVNTSDAPATIQPRERIAQIVFAAVTRAELELVDGLDETARGAGGYGSTGR